MGLHPVGCRATSGNPMMVDGILIYFDIFCEDFPFCCFGGIATLILPQELDCFHDIGSHICQFFGQTSTFWWFIMTSNNWFWAIVTLTLWLLIGCFGSHLSDKLYFEADSSVTFGYRNAQCACRLSSSCLVFECLWLCLKTAALKSSCSIMCSRWSRDISHFSQTHLFIGLNSYNICTVYTLDLRLPFFVVNSTVFSGRFPRPTHLWR